MQRTVIRGKIGTMRGRWEGRKEWEMVQSLKIHDEKRRSIDSDYIFFGIGSDHPFRWHPTLVFINSSYSFHHINAREVEYALWYMLLNSKIIYGSNSPIPNVLFLLHIPFRILREGTILRILGCGEAVKISVSFGSPDAKCNWSERYRGFILTLVLKMSYTTCGRKTHFQAYLGLHVRRYMRTRDYLG